ncbi:DUF4436 domain-containing protein [Mycobacterium paraffinicum]|uniref:DUF4436 domain-containing protein n=1 Tax=Mycobacterium paraffinicum TaxID=53378 RepID=A0A1Q4HEC2_9MYCO|nr:DUF4436 domain-containing protein [Mycobacterium paraffinicum]
MRVAAFGVVLLIGAYVVSIVLYVDGGMGHPHVVVQGTQAGDGTMLTNDVEEIQSHNSVLIANITVQPGPGLLDPRTHTLKDDLHIYAASTATSSRQTWPKGTLPTVFRVSLVLTGEVADWPFDEYHSGPVVAELSSGPEHTPVPATVTLVDRLLGWNIDVVRVNDADPTGPFRVDLFRTSSTVVFGVAILCVLIGLACLGAFVAVQTSRDRRKFQPPMTTWYAAMLFAVMPLRNALPDAPPFGSWIDITIVVWVIVVLGISMGLYISCWWRHLRPEAA